MVVTKLLTKLMGDPNEKFLRKLQPTVEHINQIEEDYQKNLTEADIVQKTAEFKERIAPHTDDPERLQEALNELLPEAFALVKFACRKLVGQSWDVRGEKVEWNMIPYDVQLLGATILHQGKAAEMKTGEGKTLVCTLPVYLNALTGKGVHVVTVNDYLAQRDAEWMGGLYKFLGLTTGVITHGQNREEKKAAYAADITYGTNNEFGFDYLRDNMARKLENCVQRGLYYAIVDEVDSILIDEARTPLIISAPAEQSTEKYTRYAQLVGQLEENTHYNVDEKARTAVLSEEGISKMEELLGVENIYTEGGFEEVNHIEQALKAQTVYQRDTDYVVKEGRIVIVDEFTGRLMDGRRYSHGLHQAIEAKENVEIKRESRTMATITFQNYFRLFDKLAGMTGTAITEAEEFATIYKLETLVIPTNKPIARDDRSDLIYKNTEGKYKAIARKVKERHEAGQPVLIGTVSIEKSEKLSQLLKAETIKHNVLNAKQHEREAEIVAKAGEKGAVTIATNMAGRGTDIKLGEGVKELGGLYVIGTERHESRRIDNQLRGRSGRQGDPGTTQFYISMEDDLMRMFGSDRVKGVMEKLGIPDDVPIENKMISGSIESAQKKVEGRNFDIRKHLVEYDDVMNQHREIMYRRRRNILEEDDLQEEIKEMLANEAQYIVMSHVDLKSKDKWNYKEIAETLSAIHRDSGNTLDVKRLSEHKKSDQLVQRATEFLYKEYETKEQSLPAPELMRKLERAVVLRVVDTLWMQHIDQMSKLRNRVALSGYGQRNPLIEYKREAFDMFSKLTATIQNQVVSTLFKVRLKIQAGTNVTPAGIMGGQTPVTTARQAPLTTPLQETATTASTPASSASEPNADGITVIKADGPTPEVKTPKKSAEPVQVIKVGPDDEPMGIAAQPDPASMGIASHPDPETATTNRSSGPKKIRIRGGQTAEITSVREEEKINRNDPCPCGSGKKYKKCCGKN